VEVRYFSLETNLPLTLALDVDTSKSVQGMLDAERTASDTFLAQMLTTPSDKAAVLHFDREVELLKDLTANKSALTNALDELGPTPAPNDQDDYDRHRGGTALYDSIYLAAHDVLANKPGRKAIIVLSDGEDRGSQETLREAIEAAERSEVVVYTIYFKGESDSSGMGPHDDGGSPRHHGGMGYPGGGGMGYPGGGGMGYPGGGSPGGGGGSRGGNRRQTQPHIDGKKIMEQIAKPAATSSKSRRRRTMLTCTNRSPMNCVSSIVWASRQPRRSPGPASTQSSCARTRATNMC
jgi:hypothetical protein